MQELHTNNKEVHLTDKSQSGLLIFLTVVALICIICTSSYAGYYFASVTNQQVEINLANQNQLYASQSLSEEMSDQKLQINTALLDAQENLNALAMRLGVLQAKVTRIEATSSRLSSLAGLESDEFDFEQAPAIGGLMDPNEQQELSVPDFINTLENLSIKLESSKQALSMLDSKMLIDKLETDSKPSGKPVQHGWLSSGFGKRTDPISGKYAFHKGLDIAGRKGSKIHSVGKGVVTWSGKQKGYGNVVEIDHGQGYVTRYAHNEKNLVKVGDKVEKGQEIALMGSTGRSTGTHVHFEVEKAGKVIDPKPYLNPLGKPLG